MDYFTQFKEKHFEDYPNKDICMAWLFYNLHSHIICYVIEAKNWYVYNERRWLKDDGGLRVMERCKDFAQALFNHAESNDDGGEKSKMFIKYVSGFHNRRRREELFHFPEEDFYQLFPHLRK